MWFNVSSKTLVQLFAGRSKCYPKSVKQLSRTLHASVGCLGKINVVNDDKYVVLNCNDQKSLKYPVIWLRDNCQCNECFHSESTSRTIDWSKFNVNVKIENVWVNLFFFSYQHVIQNIPLS